MKALCTGSSAGEVTFSISGDLPEVGLYYNIEDAIDGTSAQNKTFHSLTMEYFRSGQSSYDADNYADFKNQIKRQLGAGFEGFVYIDYLTREEPFMADSKKYNDIPEDIRKAQTIKNGFIRGKLKSWSDYTKKQRKTTIDNVINEMIQAGINTRKFQEILKGMNYDI